MNTIEKIKKSKNNFLICLKLQDVVDLGILINKRLQVKFVLDDNQI